MAPSHSPYHGTGVALAIDRDGPLIGVLIKGPSGQGKSDLAIRLIETCPWRRSLLIADDAVFLSQKSTILIMEGSQRTKDQIEARHFGIVFTHSLPSIRLDLCILLKDEIPRLPEIQTISPLENALIAIPLITLNPFTAGAPHKLRMMARKIIIAPPLCVSPNARHSSEPRACHPEIDTLTAIHQLGKTDSDDEKEER